MLISGKLKVSRFPQGRQRLSTKRGRGREKIIRRSLKIPRFPLGKGNYFHREGRDYPHRQGRQRLSTQKGRGRQKMIFGQLKTSCFPYWQIDTIHKEGKGKGEDNPWASLKLSHFLLGKWSDFPKEGRNYPHRRKIMINLVLIFPFRTMLNSLKLNKLGQGHNP